MMDLVTIQYYPTTKVTELQSELEEIYGIFSSPKGLQL